MSLYNVILGLGGIGMPEIFVIIFAILLLFGGRKIPELMRGIGKGIREFNSAKASIESEIKEGMSESEKAKIQEKKEEIKEENK